MATEYTTVVTTANGGRIKYYVSYGGSVSINIIGPAGENLVSSTGSQYNTTIPVNLAIQNIGYEITNQNRDINFYKNAITTANQKLSDPATSASERITLQNQINQYQKDLAESQANIVTLQQAQALLTSSGTSTLTSLANQAKAAVEAANNAKPANTSATTTTTTTNGPTTTTATKTTTTTANATTTTTKITSSTTTKTSGNLTGAASDDSGAKQPNPAGTTSSTPKSPAAAAGAGGTTPSSANSAASSGSTKTGVAPSGTNTPANAGTGSAAPSNATASPYKFQSSIISNQPVATASQPGKRLRNPLGEFSSYTYQITLYMVTPDAYEAFVAGGRKRINILNEASGGTANGGAFVVAQSGGVNKNSEIRAPGFEFDYGIDNLSIKHMMTGKSTGSATTISEMSFSISEPYGFSFLSNLRKAGDALAQYSKGLGKGPENPSRQFFILGIRFMGYDASGRPMLPNTKMANNGIDPTGENATQWGVVDPLSETGSLFEHFYDINIVSIKFKIDGRMVTYQCKAVATGPGKAFSTTRGFIQTNKSFTADTVGVAIDKLITQINDEQKKLAQGTPPSLTYPNKYEIIWLPGTEDIINASIISKARLEKSRWATSGAKSTAESNDATATKQQAAKENFKDFTFTPQPIVQAINDIIKQSSYLEDALAVVYTSAPEADPKTKSQPLQKPAYRKKKVSWYNCSPQITEIKWDPLVKDWSYKISYLIQKYDTPVVDTPMVQSGKIYPGPHKRYDYWYTGENREIIQYEQVLDNSYYNTVVSAGATVAAEAQNSSQPAATDPNKTGGANSQTPAQPNMQTNQPRQGSTGYGLEAQNNYLTALYDPSSYATAKITIMGDPDFLSEDPSYSEEQIYDQFYGSNSFSLNANGGQVFIEIDFKEAIDYTSQTGTMKINDSILFWKYPDSISKKIKGVSYFVISCTSTFSNGAFKQVLDCAINDFGDTTEKEAGKAAQELSQRGDQLATDQAKAAGDTGPNPGDSTTGSVDAAGTVPDKPTEAAATPAPAAPSSTKTPAQGTTPTGPGGAPVNSDDATKK